MKECIIIGINDSRSQWFPPHILEIIGKGKYFSGGKRHHEIMMPMLPVDAEWTDITVPLSDVFEKYREFFRSVAASPCGEDARGALIIFASGDPLFYGFASTVMREMPDCNVKVFPSFNSLQMLAHRMCLPYQEMHVVSLTGRPWDKFDEALIRGYDLIGCLTDRNKTPGCIMQRMQDYRYDDYVMTVGENLGNEERERVSVFESGRIYDNPNCIILQRRNVSRLAKKALGIPEAEFHLLDGRAKMITKMPIRLLTLSMLDLHEKRSFWDVGFCTGSVSIEAKLQFPHLKVAAFEIREEGRELMEKNSRKFGAPGIETVIGDFLEADLTQCERPDAVFIGGHGGKLKEMIARLHEVLLPGGCIVFNSVSESSRQMFMESIEAAGMKLIHCSRIALDNHNPINIMKAL